MKKLYALLFLSFFSFMAHADAPWDIKEFSGVVEQWSPPQSITIASRRFGLSQRFELTDASGNSLPHASLRSGANVVVKEHEGVVLSITVLTGSRSR